MTDKKDRVLIYTTVNPLSGHGGVETMILQEVKHLSSMGYRIVVLSPRPYGDVRVEKDPNVLLLHPPARRKKPWWLFRYAMFVLWFFRETSRLSREGRVICVSFTVLDAAGPALAKLLGRDVKILLRVVGPFSFEVEHYFTPVQSNLHKFAGKLAKTVELFSYLMADSILPVSEFEERNVLGYKIRKDKIRLTRCGIDESVFRGQRDAKPLALPRNAKVVMFVGRMVEKNGPLVVADAAQLVIPRTPDAVFVFVGDGVLKETIENRLQKHIVEGRVIMTGTRSDIPQLHAQAHVYAGHVSSKVEGLGQTVFEAMMSGLPVVSGRDHISERIIEDGVTGLLVPKDDPKSLADAIVRLLADEKTREVVGRSARQTALRTLSFGAMMEKLREEF